MQAMSILRSTSIYFSILFVSIICLTLLTQCSDGITPVDESEPEIVSESVTPTQELEELAFEIKLLSDSVYVLKEKASAVTDVGILERYDEVILMKVEGLLLLTEQYASTYDSIVAVIEQQKNQLDPLQDKAKVDSLTLELEAVIAHGIEEEASIAFVEKFIAVEYERIVGVIIMSSSSLSKGEEEPVSSSLPNPLAPLSSSSTEGIPQSSVDTVKNTNLSSEVQGDFSSQLGASLSSVGTSAAIQVSSSVAPQSSAVVTPSSSSFVSVSSSSSKASSSVGVSSESSVTATSSVSNASSSSVIHVLDTAAILHFGGKPKYVTIQGAMNPQWQQTGITMELWVAWDQFKEFTQLIHLSTDSNYSNMIAFGINVDGDNNKLKYTVNNHENGDGRVYWEEEIVDSVFTEIGAWKHVAVSVTPEGLTTFYVNGVAEKSVPKGKRAVPKNAVRGENYLGRGSEDWDKYFNGRMDNIRIWSGVRSAQEIVDNIYKTTDGLSDTVGLVLSYDFKYDFQDPLSITDQSSQGYHGELVNMSGTFGANGTWRPQIDFEKE
ncbi:MAG: LamG domain-containing protein [Fibrobacterales bacterium]